MKYFAAIPLAAALTFGLASSANAWFLPQSVTQDRAPSAGEFPAAFDPSAHPYHHCHGRESGTAAYACGTRTGGPSGGLF